MNFDEAQIIDLLAAIFGSRDSKIHIGIGDDGAVVETSAKSVITTDMAVEGTHFNCEWSGAFDIGRKIAAANLADIYAMGGQPTFLVVAVSLTGDETLEWISELAEGIKHEANSCAAAVVGGDLTRGRIKTISITAIGSVENPITRHGAQVGDSIYLSSLPGWSAAGLHFIGKDDVSDLQKYAIDEFCAPNLDYSLALAFANKGAHAMCDISDALIIQADQISNSSKVKLVFEKTGFEGDSEFAQLNELAQSADIDVWQWIIAGGEDHVFLATGRDLPGICVGNVVEGEGVVGLEMKKAPDTWRHFK
jgi:thiamine-monophosphate kinase